MKKLRVTVEGKAYEVLVEILDEGTATASPTPTAANTGATVVAPAAAAPSAAPRGTAAVGDVVSPLAGKLVSYDVKVDQAVAEGAQVATVEAMKMNTYIYAPMAGKVTALLITPGEGVDEGTVLLRIA
jgi:biotin carboxyl carrier protein